MDAGLDAAASVYDEAVKARLAGGYTSGHFVGHHAKSVVDSVRHTKPFNDQNGNRSVSSGSNDFRTKLWEFGHHNAFTRRFERVEHFREAMDEAGPEMAKAFHEVFSAALE